MENGSRNIPNFFNYVVPTVMAYFAFCAHTGNYQFAVLFTQGHAGK